MLFHKSCALFKRPASCVQGLRTFGEGSEKVWFWLQSGSLMMFICLQSLGILGLFEMRPGTWRTMARVIKLMRTSENSKSREDLAIIDLEAFRRVDTLSGIENCGEMW